MQIKMLTENSASCAALREASMRSEWVGQCRVLGSTQRLNIARRMHKLCTFIMRNCRKAEILLAALERI